MKLTRKEFESQLALAQTLPDEQQTKQLDTLKAAEVFDIVDGKEVKVEVEVVKAAKPATAAPASNAADIAAAVKAAMEPLVKALPTQPITQATAPATFFIPSNVYRIQPKNFRNRSGDKFDAIQKAYRFGMWARAARGDRKALDWCEKNDIHVVASDDPDARFGTKAGQVENSNTAGGFLVPPEFDADIIDLREQYGVFRQNARVKPMMRDTLNRNRRTGGLTARFTGESTGQSSSAKSWDQITLTAKKLIVTGFISNELAEDATISVADDLAGEVGYAFALKEDQCGFIGDGSSTYGGISGVMSKINDGNHTASIVTAATGGTGYGTMVLADAESVIGKLPLYARTGAKWYISAVGYSAYMQRVMYAAGGNSVDNLSRGVPASFMGFPVELVQVMNSTLGAQTSTLVAFLGNLQLAADFGDRRGTTIAFSEHATVDGVSAFDTDQVAFRGTERFDINVHDLGDTSNAGPIVALKTAAS